MRVRLLPSAWGENYQYLTTFILNDTIALDAGSLGFASTLADQARIRHILLTHSHLDHLASLPMFIENVYLLAESPVTIHAHEAVLSVLRTDLFNGRLWAPIDVLTKPGSEFFLLNELVSGQTIALEGLRITPILVNHVVPTCAYLLEDDQSAIVVSSDTGPTEDLWRIARAKANLKAVFLEVTFPNRLTDLAEITKHLTPSLFRVESAKLQPSSARVVAVHLKARFHDEIVAELAGVELIEPGRTYQF